jgi:hypothetical protein
MDQERKTKDKFKIISLPVQPDVDYYPDMVRRTDIDEFWSRIRSFVYGLAV